MQAEGTDAAVTLHGLSGPSGTRLARWLAGGDHLLGRLRPLVGPSPALIVAVRGPADLLARAGAGLGTGPAVAEAVAVRLRARTPLRSGDPMREVDRRALAELCAARGRDAVRVLRADPALLPEVQAGSWWVGGWRTRLVRRAGLAAPALTRWLPAPMLADVAFWSGVRAAAGRPGWRRLTGSYVVLCYHRVAGAGRPGQERMDVAPRTLRRQLRLLQVLGWRSLSAAELVDFHSRPDAVLSRRRYVLTADDGFADALQELLPYGRRRPQAFAVTGSVGGSADWLGGEPLAGWAQLRRWHDAGGLVGSHARRHVPLDTLPDEEIVAEVAGSLADLRDRMPADVPLLAYPHGRHDARVRAAARDAGYLAAYTTGQGRNGAGTDRWCLRRVEPKAWDSTASFAWKLLTGESPPAWWERRLRRRWDARRARSVLPPG